MSLLILFLQFFIWFSLSCQIKDKQKIEAFNATHSFRLKAKFYEKYILLLMFIFSIIFGILRIFQYFLNDQKTNLQNNSKFLFSFLSQINQLLHFNSQNPKKDLIFYGVLISMIGFTYFINRTHEIYYDHYKIEILKNILKKFRIVLYLFFLPTYIFFKFKEYSSFCSLLEITIITIFAIEYFLKFQQGFFKIFEKYLKFLNLIYNFRLIFLYIYIFYMKFKDSKGNQFILNEIQFCMFSKFQFTLFFAHILTLNYLNFINEFFINFPEKQKKIKFNELFDKPYQLFFIKTFSKKLINILNVFNFNKNKISLNYDLKFNFYEDLRQIHFFQKQLQINLKSKIKQIKLSWIYQFNEFFQKYFIIINIYKFRIFKVVLDLFIIIYFSYFLNILNIFSIFYFLIILIIIIKPEFSFLWNSLLILNILPNICVLIGYIVLQIIKMINKNYITFFDKKLLILLNLENFNTIPFFIQSFLITSIYLYLQYNIWLKIKNDVNSSLMTILKKNKLTILEIDEDLVYLFKKIFEIILIIVKYVIYYIIMSQIIHTVNILNLMIIIALLICIIMNNQFFSYVFNNFYFSIIIAKYLIRYKNFLGSFESHFYLLFGLSLNSHRSLKDDFQVYFEEEQNSILYQFILIFFLYLLYELDKNNKQKEIIHTIKSLTYSTIYSYFAEFFEYISSGFNQTKIYLIYFFVFSCSIQADNSILDITEFVFTILMLSMHMYLFSKQKTLNVVFLILFTIYFLLIIFMFLISYNQQLKFLMQNDIDENSNLIDWNELKISSSKRNSIFIIKILLTILAIKTIVKFLWGQDQVKKQFIKKTKIFYIYDQAFKIISVFVKEITLFYTVWSFIKSPNFFGLLYLGNYLFYFQGQIKALLEILNKFKFKDLIYSKINYYKKYLTSKTPKIQNEFTNLFDPVYENTGIFYYTFLKDQIFNCIYKYVDQSWTISYLIILLYMIWIYIISCIKVELIKEKFIFQILFNFQGYQINELKSIFLKLVIVLLVTVLELYFVNALRLREKRNEETISNLLIEILNLRYQVLNISIQRSFDIMNSEEKVLSQTLQIKLENIKELLKESLLDKSIEEFKFKEDSQITPENQPIVTNINLELHNKDKSLLLIRNRSKMCFLQVILGILFTSEQLLLLPITLGFLFSSYNSLFIFIGIFLFFVKRNSEVYYKQINMINFILVFLACFEYIIMIQQLQIQKLITSFISIKLSFINNLQITGLSYLFVYVSFFKLFFMICLIIGYLVYVEIDQISGKFISKIKRYAETNLKFFMINYNDWVEDSMQFYFTFKNQVIKNIGSYYFLLSMIFYIKKLGLLEIFAIIIMLCYKFYINKMLEQNFSQIMKPKHKLFYQIIQSINWINFFTIQWQKNFTNIFGDNSNYNTFLFAFCLQFNILILELIDNQEFQKEVDIIREYFQIKAQLVNLLRIYDYNEDKTFKNSKQFLTFQFMEKKSYKIFPIEQNYSNKGNKTEVIEESNTLQNLSVFLNKESYERYLCSYLGIFKSSVLKIQLYIRKKLFLSYSSSRNFLSLISNFVQRNKQFIGYNHRFDIFKIFQGDLQDLKLLIQMVEQNSEVFMQKGYIDIVKQKIQEIKIGNTPATPTLPKERFKHVPTQQEISLGVSKGASQFYQKLMNIDTSEQIKMAQNDSFFSTNFKHKINSHAFMILMNYDSVNSYLHDYKSIQFTYYVYFLSIQNYISENLNVILNITLVILFCMKEGFFGTIFIFINIYMILIEDNIINFKNWEKSYIVFLIVFILRIFIVFFVQISIKQTENENNQNILLKYELFRFFYGNADQMYILFVFLIYEMIFMRIGDAFMNKTFSEIENPSQSIFRLSFNEGLKDIFDKKNNLIMAELTILEEKVKNKYKKILNEKDYMIFLINMAKQKISLFKGLKEKFDNYLKIINSLIPLYNKDKIFFNKENYKDYFWRNFNCYLRKPGKDLHNYLFQIQFITLIYFIVYFYSFKNENKNTFKSIFNNDIEGTLSVNISFLFFCICTERFLQQINNYKWVGSIQTHRDQVISILKSKNINLNRLKIKINCKLDLLKLSVKKWLIINRLKKPSSQNIKEQYKHNPLIFRMIFTIIYWTYMTFIIFIWFPIFSNIQKDQTPKTFSDNIYLQILFLLVNFYTIISIYQIRIGFSLLTYIKHVDYQNILNRINYYIYKFTPFVREMKILIDYSAQKTALNMFQLFKQEDMETAVQSAQVNEIANQYSWSKSERIFKKLLGIFLLFLILILLIAPLFIFSDILPSRQKNIIISANIILTAKLSTSSFQLINNKNIQNKNLKSYSYEYKIIQTKDMYRNYPYDLYKKIVFDKISKEKFEITEETKEQIKNEYQKNKFLKILLDIDFLTQYKGKLSKNYEYQLNPNNEALFIDILTSKKNCFLKNNANIILGIESQLIDLKTLLGSHNIKSNQPNIFDIIFFLKFKCDPIQNKLTFELTNQNSQNLEFIVLNEYIKTSVEILQQISEKTVSVFSIYILIFSYIGITLIRKGFFDQAHILWITEIPNAQKLQIYQYLVLFSRLKGDLYKEELFYYYFIDLFRNPGKIKEITGPIENPYTKRKKFYYIQFNMIQSFYINLQ